MNVDALGKLGGVKRKKKNWKKDRHRQFLFAVSAVAFTKTSRTELEQVLPGLVLALNLNRAGWRPGM